MQDLTLAGFWYGASKPFYSIFIKDTPKISLSEKLILYAGFIFGLKLCQLIWLVAFLENNEKPSKTRKITPTSNEFLDAIARI